MIGSLGDALAGVSLGSTTTTPGSSSAAAAAAAVNNPNNPFQTPTLAAITTTTTTTNTTTTATPTNGSHGGWGSVASDDHAVSVSATSNATTPNNGNQGLGLFLSQSPSQMLGNDVFKQLNGGGGGGGNAVASNSTLPGLSIPENGVTGGGPVVSASASFDQQAQLHHQQQHRTSPSSNVTGTTTASTATRSRSNSPYENSAGGVGGTPMVGHTIQGYSTSAAVVQSPAAIARQAPSMAVASTPTPPQQPLYVQQQLQQEQQQFQQQQQQYQQYQPPMQMQQQQQQSQILYMMVPTPDGRGQVLQPVQVVQMPNKTFAYVMPGMDGGIQAAMAPPPPQPQPMMVMMPGQQQQVTGPPPGMMPSQAAAPQAQQLQQAMGVGGQTLVNGRANSAIGGRNLNSASGGGVGATYGSAALGGTTVDDYGLDGIGIGGMTATTGGGGGGVDLNQYMTPAQTGATDPTLASLYTTPQRPPLDALLGQIRKLSRDQVGCRMVQQALDVEGPMAATLILNEGLPFWGEAVVDPFGNYLFQKILERITAEERVMLVKSVSPRLVNASLNLHGTRSVQKIVELCAMDEEEAKRNKSATPTDQANDCGHGGTEGDMEETAAGLLTNALTPAAARLCIDSHGNHVIQRILLKLDPKYSQFVFDAVAEGVGDVARHRHGCCVIQRCLDSPAGPARSHLVRRIVDNSLELMQDAYGNYVVQYVLDVCSDEDVHAVCESVVGRVNLLAIQKFSSNVMEKCLERCTDRVKELYMQELSNTERVRELMMDPFGNYVIQRALTVATHAQAIRLVEAMRPHLIAQAPGTPNGQRNGGVRNTAGGRRIMAKICRRFPNFNLNAGGTTEELYSQNRGRHHNHHGAPLAAAPVYSIASMAPQFTTQLAPQMSQNAPGPIQQPQQQQQPIQQPQQQQTLYSTNETPTDFLVANSLGMNPLNMGGLQFDQQEAQPFYNLGDANAAYFQHTPQMGHGAYPSGL